MAVLIVSEEDMGMRLDSYLAKRDPSMSRSAFQRLAEEGAVTVDGRVVKVSHKVEPGEVVAYHMPPPRPSEMPPEEIPLDIVYEDDDLIVLNKPKGMVVHPAPGAPAGTLVNGLLAHAKGLSTIGGVERPGIVHRLDKDTSGLMMVAKNDAAHISLQKQIQTRVAARRYLALVWGNPAWDRSEVDAPVGRHPVHRKKMAVIEAESGRRAKEAVTDFRVLGRFGCITLVEASLRTGRTHQVRVHSAYAGHPVVGDPLYSGDRRLQAGSRGFVDNVNRLIDALGGQALHAYYLSFDHPRTGERMEFTAPEPEEMENLLRFLREHCE